MPIRPPSVTRTVRSGSLPPSFLEPTLAKADLSRSSSKTLNPYWSGLFLLLCLMGIFFLPRYWKGLQANNHLYTNSWANESQRVNAEKERLRKIIEARKQAQQRQNGRTSVNEPRPQNGAREVDIKKQKTYRGQTW